jgi:hypothetical protein
MITPAKLQQVRSTTVGVLAVLTGLFFFAHLALSIELTEPEGAAHAYPALLDLNGKKLADGEFMQWSENGRLHVKITYKFTGGDRFEEQTSLRQKPDLAQEKWSWRELKNGKVSREFSLNLLSKTATAQKLENGQIKYWSQQLEVDPGRTFAGFGFTIALQNLRERLVAGERVELKAAGFTPKPQVVTVQISYGGLDQMRMSGRLLKGDRFVIHPEIPPIAKLFVHVRDTQIWLTNPPPAGFLRWEGPIAEPSDPLIRVDLVSGVGSGPAKAVVARQ